MILQNQNCLLNLTAQWNEYRTRTLLLSGRAVLGRKQQAKQPVVAWAQPTNPSVRFTKVNVGILRTQHMCQCDSHQKKKHTEDQSSTCALEQREYRDQVVNVEGCQARWVSRVQGPDVRKLDSSTKIHKCVTWIVAGRSCFHGPSCSESQTRN